MSEPVPDRFAFAVLIPCPFHLIRGSGGSPDKSLGKARLLNDRLRNGTGYRSRRLIGRPWSGSIVTLSNKCCVCCCRNGVGHKFTTVHARPISLWVQRLKRIANDGTARVPE